MKSLFETAKIGGLELKNRFVRSATWLRQAEKDGHINDSLIKAYLDLAKGGVGLVITGYAFVCKEEKPNPGMLGAYDDSFIDDFQKLAETAHDHKCKIALQIVYGGTQCTCGKKEAEKMNLLGASAVYNPHTQLTPKRATKEDIKELIKSFGRAALRAKKSGMDGVQIHAAHGYLLSQWLSPYFNKRTDEYGGKPEKRARIIYEVYEEIRRQVGEKYPVMIKLNCDDFMGEQGITKKDTIPIAVKLDRLGIDAIEVSGGNISGVGSFEKTARKWVLQTDKQSYFKEEAAEFASHMKHTKIMLVGGNRDFGLMTKILNSTEIEFFSMARPLLCEPDLINRWQEQSLYKAQCVACNHCFGLEKNDCLMNRHESRVEERKKCGKSI